MKLRSTLLAISVSTIASTAMTHAQLGGDPTTPPSGAPTRTMKTLDQVEARIPLVDGAPGVTLEANGGFTITASGSYYMTENLNISSGHGVSIAASTVTIDMNGFTIHGTGGGGSNTSAFHVVSNSGLTIKNGFITSTYTASGAFYSGGSYTGTGFGSAVTGSTAGVSILSNVGIVGSEVSMFFSLISNCHLNVSDDSGFSARRIVDSTAEGCMGTALSGDIISGSYGFSSTGIGIEGNVVTNSYGKSRTGNAISGTTVTGSFGDSSDQSGIEAEIVIASYGESVAGFAIESNGVIAHSYALDDIDDPSGAPLNSAPITIGTHTYLDD